MDKLRITYEDPKTLTLDPRNARLHPEPNQKAINYSLSEFDFRKVAICVWEKNQTVYAGNALVTEAIRRGYTEVPVAWIPADWTEAKVKAFGIADNRSTELAEWHLPNLDETLEEIKLDFNLDDLGFSETDLDTLFADQRKLEATDDDFDTTPETEAVSRLGDLWMLGRHRVLCGDCTVRENVERVMGGERIVFCPDLAPITCPEGHKSEGLMQQRGGPIWGCFNSYELSIPDWNLLKAWKKNPEIYPSVTTRMAVDISTLLRWVLWIDSPVNYHHLVISTPPQGVSKGKPYPAGFLGKEVSNILSFDYTVIFDTQDNRKYHGRMESLRKSPKEYIAIVQPDCPCILIDDLCTTGETLRKSRDALLSVGSIAMVWLFFNGGMSPIKKSVFPVFDPFLGSGTTMIACEQLDRTCMGLELEPRYVDVVCRRFVSFVSSPEGVWCERDGERLTYQELFRE